VIHHEGLEAHEGISNSGLEERMRSAHRKVVVVGAALVAALAITDIVTLGQGQASNEFPNPYKIETWGQLPAGRKMGATYGIDIDRDGKSVWVFERCGGATCDGSNLAPLLKFDTSGKLIASFGAGMFIFPHGIFIDRDDNVWVTDGRGKGAKGQQVVKFSPTGRVLLTLGKPGVAGDGPDTFNQPSDVLVAPNGDVFVADGHGGESNARIVKFDKDGQFLKTWGKKGSGPGEFDTPHGLVMDAQGRLLVADRGNSRIQVFDQDGKFLAEWKQFGRPSGIFLDRAGMLYSADSQSNTPTVNPTLKRGVRIGAERGGKVRYFVPDPDSIEAAGGREGIAVDRDGVVYVAKTGNGGLYRYVKQPSGTR
jgi:sugar lactone lactonase YvrE